MQKTSTAPFAVQAGSGQLACTAVLHHQQQVQPVANVAEGYRLALPSKLTLCRPVLRETKNANLLPPTYNPQIFCVKPSLWHPGAILKIPALS